jgi:DNA topoisomerase-1
MKLVIIESPNKIKKLKSILSSDYEIVASVGHLFDLPKKELGIDLETFDTELVLSEDKKDILANIKKSADQADIIYLASDADREGSGISKNIFDSLTKKNQKKCKRLLINAITKEAVELAIKNPTDIDLNLCNAQKGRRVTDRLVGYQISPVMWTKGLKGTSAGRVQSVALKYVADLEKEINAFTSEEYWKATLKGDGFSAELSTIDGSTYNPKTKAGAEAMKKDILSGKATAKVSEYSKKVRTRSPEPPFITSTVQQAASNLFGWNAQKTMQVAQTLFAAGLITYLRCFPGDTRISTPSGMIKISDLAIGDLVDTMNGPRKILDVVKNKDRDIISIETNHGYKVRGSKNEPLLVINEDLSLCWKKMSEIRPGDFVALANSHIMSWPESSIEFDYIDQFLEELGENGLLKCCICERDDISSLSPHLKHIHGMKAEDYCKKYNKKVLHTALTKQCSIPKKMSVELAKVLGYMCSEGCFNKEESSLVFSNTDSDLLSDFASCYNHVFGTKKVPYFKSEKFETSSQMVWDFLNWVGLDPVYANKKRVPWSIMQGTREQAIAFLKSYWEGDGSYEVIISSSPDMLSDLKLLLLKLGVPTGGGKKDSCGYIQFTGSAARKFFSLIGKPVSKSRVLQVEKILSRSGNTRASEYSWHNKIPYSKGVISKLVKENMTAGGWLKSTTAGKKIRIKTARSSTWNRKNGEIGYTNVFDKSWGSFVDYSNSKDWVDMSLYDFVNMCDESTAKKIKSIMSKNCHWDGVKTTSECPAEDTWDLTVDDQSHYIAEGFVAHNTDSTRIEPDKIKSIREKVEAKLGKNYLSPSPRSYSNKDAAQDAHEAIRPTYDQPLAPLAPDETKLLGLIDKRFKASQMADATFDQASLKIEIKSQKHTYIFRVNGSIMTFDGFLKVYGENKEDLILPQMSIGSAVEVSDIVSSQHFTQPPGRYSDASLIKKLEKEGVGRPSTYASIIETLINRGYASRDKKSVHATELGIMVSDYLSHSFPLLVSPEMTAKMEEDLDAIASGKGDYLKVMTAFYAALATSISEAKKISPVDIFKTDRVCKECESPMVKRKGEHDIFFGCSSWPKCGHTLKIGVDGEEVSENEETAEPCPECGGALKERMSKFGKPFFGCGNYPTCTYIKRDKPSSGNKSEITKIKCTKCKDSLMRKITMKDGSQFLGCCSYPACKATVNLDKNGNIVKYK